jgi:hypothetical protein
MSHLGGEPQFCALNELTRVYLLPNRAQRYRFSTRRTVASATNPIVPTAIPAIPGLPIKNCVCNGVEGSEAAFSGHEEVGLSIMFDQKRRGMARPDRPILLPDDPAGFQMHFQMQSEARRCCLLRSFLRRKSGDDDVLTEPATPSHACV